MHGVSRHVMTSSLVDQSGPDYTSTLRVRGRRDGKYSCTVSNSKGTSRRILTVTGTCRMTLTEVHAWYSRSTFVHFIGHIISLLSSS